MNRIIEQDNLNDNELDLVKFFSILWNDKFKITAITLIAALLSILIAITQPNIYTASAILAPSTTNDNLSNKLSQFSTIAGFAGVNLPPSNATPAQEAIKRMKTFEFFSKYFLPNINIYNLYAVDEWNSDNDTIIYNDEIDAGKQSSMTTASSNKIPSDQDLFLIYKKIINISVDQKTLFVTLSVEHKSPNIAKKWVNIIIKNINSSMRFEDNKIASDSVNYLTEYSESTNIQSLKDSISNLLESQMQTLMLTSSIENYVFKTLDPPIAPEERSSPNRALICIFGTLLGGMISVFYVLISFFIIKKRV